MKRRDHNLRIAKQLQTIAKALNSQAETAKRMGLKTLPIEPDKLAEATEPLVKLSGFLIENIEAETED